MKSEEKSPSTDGLSECGHRSRTTKHQIGLRRGRLYPQVPIGEDEVAFEALPPPTRDEQELHLAEAARRQVQGMDELLKLKTPEERWEKLAATATDFAGQLSAQEMFVAAGMYDGVGVKVVRPWVKAHARLAKVRDALSWVADKATRIASYFEGVAQKFKSRARGIEERNYLSPPWTEPKKVVFYVDGKRREI